jgi:hypothetical protein
MHPDGEGWVRISEGLDKIFEENPEWREFQRFSVVRHPFTRMVSCYIDKIMDLNEDKHRMLTKAGMSTLPNSFAEFVDFVCSEQGRDAVANAHWGSQSAILCDDRGALAVDIVGRLESLDEDLAQIFETLEMDMPKNYRHKNQRSLHAANKPSVSTEDENYWTDAVERRLMDRFRLDYELFGYRSFGQVS